MSKPSVRVLGVYELTVTADLLAQAIESKFGEHDLSDENEDVVREELEGAVLIEALVENRDSRFRVDDFAQPDSDQAAYGEVFLSEEGTAMISEGEVPAGPTLRIAFFLHFFDPTLPLQTSYGEVALPEAQPMPDRLATLVPCEPVT